MGESIVYVDYNIKEIWYPGIVGKIEKVKLFQKKYDFFKVFISLTVFRRMKKVEKYGWMLFRCHKRLLKIPLCVAVTSKQKTFIQQTRDSY